MNEQEYAAVDIFKALADPTRLDVVRQLASKPVDIPGQELVLGCATTNRLSQPAMSHHFSKLVDSGILSERKVGTEKRYVLNTALLRSVGIDPNKL